MSASRDLVTITDGAEAHRSLLASMSVYSARVGWRKTYALSELSMSGSGLGCVKTQTCCGAVEWRSQASHVLLLARGSPLGSADAEA